MKIDREAVLKPLHLPCVLVVSDITLNNPDDNCTVNQKAAALFWINILRIENTRSAYVVLTEDDYYEALDSLLSDWAVKVEAALGVRKIRPDMFCIGLSFNHVKNKHFLLLNNEQPDSYINGLTGVRV